MRVSRVLAALVGAAMMAAAGPAQAHIIATRLGDFYAGALHPLAGLEDPLLWLALGLLAGQQEVGKARWVVLAFPLAMLAGLLGARLSGMPPVPAFLDAGAMVIVGGLVAAAIPLAGPLLPGVAILLGTLCGATNASGLGSDTNAELFTAGLLLSGYALVTLLTAVSAAVRRCAVAWPSIAVRACGSWIVAVGLMAGGLALVRH